VTKKQDWKKVGEIVAKVRELGLSYKDGAKKFGVKPWVLYDHNRKKNKHDTSGTNEATVPAKLETANHEARENTGAGATLPGDVGELICSYRRAHREHGFKRIQDLLKQKHLVVVTRKQIRRVLKDAGLLESCDSSFDREPEPAKGSRRFEAAYPGEMWQMDLTYVYISGIPVLYLVLIIDDQPVLHRGRVGARPARRHAHRHPAQRRDGLRPAPQAADRPGIGFLQLEP